jgi:hypothetical protein
LISASNTPVEEFSRQSFSVTAFLFRLVFVFMLLLFAAIGLHPADWKTEFQLRVWPT